MFNKLIKRLFARKANKNQPNFLAFEQTRQVYKDQNEQPHIVTAGGGRHCAGLEKSQASVTPLMSIEERNQQAFYDCLFGESHTSDSQDELANYISTRIEQLLKSPKAILASLPVLPASLTQVVQHLGDDEFDTDLIVDLLQKEPAIAAKVIELANSPFYNRGNKEVTDLKSAFMQLGSQGLTEGVINGFMSKLVPQKDLYFAHYGRKIWQHSLTTGAIAKDILRQTSQSKDTNLAYLVGLISSLGDIIIYQLMTEAFSVVHPDSKPSSALFKQLLKDNGKKLTYFIAKYWQLPQAIIDILAIQTKLTQTSMLAGISKRYPNACYLYEAKVVSKLVMRLETGNLSPDEATELMDSLLDSNAARKSLEPYLIKYSGSE